MTSQLFNQLFNQPEISAFVAGLSLLWAAALALRIGQGEQPRAWTLLGFFALLQGLAQWLLLAPTGGSYNTFVGLLRLGISAVSFVVLIEFGRREIKRDAKRLPKSSIYWIHAPILIVAALIVAIGGSTRIDPACRYALALPSGLLAALAIAKVTDKHHNAGWARMLLAAAIAFFALGYAKAIMPLQAFAVLGLLIGIWREYRQQFPLPAHVRAIARWRLPAAFVGLAMLGVAGLAARERLHDQSSQTSRAYALGGESEAGATADLADTVTIDTRQLARDKAAAGRYKQGAAILVVVVVIAAVWIGVSYLPRLR